MTQTSIVCPHCAVPNTLGAAFCGSCGMALPLAPSVPRVLSGADMPTSAAGAKLMGDELTKQMKSAANTLLAVGAIQFIVAGILFAVVKGAAGVVNPRAAIVLAQTVVVGAVFIGLYFWARVAPLPASIIGLIIYGTLIVINVVIRIGELAQNGPAAGNGIGGLGVGWLDIVILFFLARGVSAALKYRKLQASQLQS